MASQRPRVLLLTGAPKASDINEKLQDAFLASIEGFLGDQEAILQESRQDKLSSVPNWRSVPSLSYANLPSFHSNQSYDLRLGGTSQSYLPRTIDLRAVSSEPDTNNASAFPESASDVPTSNVHSQYLRHSLAFHETLQSSQIEPPCDSETDTGNVVSFPTASFSFQNSPFDDSCVPGAAPIECAAIAGDNSHISMQLPFNLPITPLGMLPSAEYLDSIYPQTLTPNLVGIIASISPPRSVITRSNKVMMLYDIRVADETGSDFTMTFWLPPRPNSEENVTNPEKQSELRKAIDYLRSGDVVFLRNIALSHFRGTVHGQSLHPHISRARTGLYPLARAGSDLISTDQLGPALREKIETVKLWAKQFVSTNIVRPSAQREERKRKRKRELEGNSLPLDTQF